MRRSLVSLVAFVMAVSACAESSADPGNSAVVMTTVTEASAPVGATTTVVPGDFGSRYNGSPVAFWFWAPY